MLRTGIGDLRAFEGVVGPNFGLYFEDLKNFWAEILGSPGPTRTTHWARHCIT